MRRSRLYVPLFLLALMPLTAGAGAPKLQTSPDAAGLYDLATRESQHRSLSAMPQVDLEYGPYGRIRKIEGRTGIFVPSTLRLKPNDKATELFQRIKGVLMASGSESLVVKVSGRTPTGDGYYAFAEQTIHNIPVIDARVNIVVAADGEVQTINSLFVPHGTARVTPDISAQVAKAKLKEQMADPASSLMIQTDGSLAFWTNEGQEKSPRLLWMFDCLYSKDGASQSVRFGVDAATGDVRYTQQLSSDLNRTVYSNGYRSDTTTPQASALLWTEGNPNASDAQAFSMYNLVVHPIQTWFPGGHAFAYDSVGLVAHYSGTNAAFHIFGTDNKSYLFAGDARALDADAIAHEYAHGMFGRIGNMPSNFARYDDWFAGNEFFGDASAVITDIRRFGISSASWQITNLRSWQNPKSLGPLYNDWYPERLFANPLQPAYSNATIYGHAVYLMINGGLHGRQGTTTLAGTIPAINVPAQPYLHIQKVLSHGLYLLALNNERFTAQRYKARTIEAATLNFGAGSGVPFTVERAWTAVGIGYNCSAPPSMPQPTVQTEYCKGRHTISWPGLANVKYHGQVVRYPFAWDSLQVQDTVDGTMTECSANVSSYSRYRMRACNACGCSQWTADEWMEYWSPCQ